MNGETGSGRDDLEPEDLPAEARDVYGDKVALPTGELLALGVLAGVYIAFGSVFSLVVLAMPDGAAPFGVVQLLAGVAFSLGLILVMIAGAELFTGNTLMVTLWLRRETSWARIGRAWGLAYVGNFAGSLLVVALFIAAGGHAAGGGEVGIAALGTAGDKTAMEYQAIFASGILANMLVCLAVWMTFAARSVQGKIIAMIPPIAAFVAAGLEHSVANMSLIPMGLGIAMFAGPEFWGESSRASIDASLTLGWFGWNLLWSTIGNIVGGALIATAYWAAYDRG